MNTVPVLQKVDKDKVFVNWLVCLERKINTFKFGHFGAATIGRTTIGRMTIWRKSGGYKDVFYKTLFGITLE